MRWESGLRGMEGIAIAAALVLLLLVYASSKLFGWP